MYTNRFIVLYLKDHLHVHIGTFGGQKRALDSLELELQAVVSHHVVKGTKPGCSERATSALNP